MEVIETKRYNGGSKWLHKKHGVIYVERDWQIAELHELLCRQDEYWESKSHLIKHWIGPKYMKQVREDAEYVGKTDIYEVEELRKIVPFIFFQFDEDGCIEENHE